MTSDRERIQAQMARPLVLRLWEALLPLKSVVTFLNTGAHPDDETTGLLTVLHRQYGVRIAIACSTRGEGGQNALGSERGAELALIRTREMEEAARVLDATVYWFAEYPGEGIHDFGFSKDGDDTLRRWGQQTVLKRMVEIIRHCRPDIACPTFLDVPGQHGHHRAMTRTLIEAVPLAADPDAFPEQVGAGLRPYKVPKLYLPAWSGAGDSYDDDEPPPSATTSVEASGIEPVTGASFAQLAQWSRQFHASQGMGRWIMDDRLSYPLHRLDNPVEEAGLFDGLALRLADLGEQAPAAASALRDADTAIDAAIAAWPETDALGSHLATALERLRQVSVPDDLADRIDRKKLELERAIVLARHAQVITRSDRSTLAPGGSAGLEVHASGVEAELLSHMPGLHVAGGGDRCFEVSLASKVSLPLALPLLMDPLQPAEPIVCRNQTEAFGSTVATVAKLDESLTIVPALTLDAEPDALIVKNCPTTRDVRLRFHAYEEQVIDAIDLDGMPGLTVRPGSNLPVRLDPGQSLDIAVTVEVEPQMAAGSFAPTWRVNGLPASRLRVATYPHTGRTALVQPCVLRIARTSFEIAPGTRVAYVGGGNDHLAKSLELMGVDTVTFAADQLTDDVLRGFSTLLIGIFAFRTAPKLFDQIPLIHDYVRKGGHLLTLYHKPSDNWQPEQVPLAPLTIGSPSLRWRVTDEAAPLEHLAPEHFLLNQPNRIGDEDWAGWVKERGLYFASAWDEAYEPLLAMGDVGEQPLKGALLSGRFGEGRHTHTSLVLHTQLEAMVPGAVRLMANLIAPAP